MLLGVLLQNLLDRCEFMAGLQFLLALATDKNEVALPRDIVDTE